ncbi:MAG: Nif3-like dinuclear metal center hexameric protein [Actinomycetota bacterium]|nr:Nif3-like dinuclear metal center hexameric protein [Actinomycetota bacterium]
MTLDDLVARLDAYFRVADVRNDDWTPIFDALYPEPYWRDYAEPGYEGRWNGLFVRGAADVERVATCVFPSDEIVSRLEPRTLLFSEHPIDDAPGDLFTPLARATFELMKERGITLYHVHAPLDMHPDVSPSRLCAEGLGLSGLAEYFPIADGIPGGAAVIGASDETVDELAARLQRFLGDDVPVRLLSRQRERAGRVAVVAGGGAQREILEASLERGCETYVTGNAASPCPLDHVQEGIAAFRELADAERVAIVDGTHYGTEKPPQLAMVGWFERLGLPAAFEPGRPERT